MGFSNKRVKITIMMGITITALAPNHIFWSKGFPSISPGLKSPAKILNTSPNK